jgi:yecA family protein
MTPDDIRLGLETAVGVPEAALRAAVEQAAAIAPAVIAVARGLVDGCMPLPPQERLLRFGLHALSVARETSACPAFLALLRRPEHEVMWLFGQEERSTRIARLLLGLFDGDDEAVIGLIAERSVDEHVRDGLFQALARLIWEGRASRARLVALLDRFDREILAEAGSFAWFGWQEAILLLGLTDWIDRVKAAWKAGREIPMYEREVDRTDWIARTCAAADHPDDPKRFIDDTLVPYEDSTKDLGWSPDQDGGPDDPLNEDELEWIHVALWRRADSNSMTFEGADGFLTALAVTPLRSRSPLTAYLPIILGDGVKYESPEHQRYIAGLLARHLLGITSALEHDEGIRPFIADVDDLSGVLWANGYFDGAKALGAAWDKLRGKQSIAEHLVMPIIALLPDDKTPTKSILSYTKRWELIEALPDIIAANWAFFRDEYHPLLAPPPERRVKIGRNDPCPCGSGKKYKRCCAATA